MIWIALLAGILSTLKTPRDLAMPTYHNSLLIYRKSMIRTHILARSKSKYLIRANRAFKLSLKIKYYF